MKVALDTNVVSELIKADCNPAVARWIQSFAPEELFLPAPCWAELRRGILLLPVGRRRDWLDQHLTRMVEGLAAVLPLGRRESEVFAQLQAVPGRPLPTVDAMIAAICLVHDLPLATRNTQDFEATGVGLINPWLA